MQIAKSYSQSLQPHGRRQDCQKPPQINWRLSLPQQVKDFSTHIEALVDNVTYEKVCEETLQSLSDYFEQLVEEFEQFKTADVSYASGVLTVNLGGSYGTYVINRQSPNRQIWLSSPSSGPKRYDFVVQDQCWIYRHTGESLHQLLQKELSNIVNTQVDLSQLSYAKC